MLHGVPHETSYHWRAPTATDPCFQIVGVNSTPGAAYAEVDILLDQVPVQGGTYALGLGGGNWGLGVVIGDTGSS